MSNDHLHVNLWLLVLKNLNIGSLLQLKIFRNLTDFSDKYIWKCRKNLINETIKKSKCSLEIFTLLLKANVDANCVIQKNLQCKLSRRSYRQTTLLMFLSKQTEKFGFIKALLDHKADPNITDYNGSSALHYLCGHNNYKYIKLFIDYKANINLESENGRTPLMSCGHDNETIMELLKYGADLQYKNRFNNNALYYACIHNDLERVKKLIELGIQIDPSLLDFVQNKINDFSSWYEIRKRYRNIYKLLISNI